VAGESSWRWINRQGFVVHSQSRGKGEGAARDAGGLARRGDQGKSEQRDINKAEATNPSVFVAGWRPAVGWLCVATLAYQWILAPTISWAFVATGHDLMPLPALGRDDAQTLLYALLGIGGLRSIDKITGSDTVAVGARGLLSSLPFIGSKK
jgi:hypothetical protein